MSDPVARAIQRLAAVCVLAFAALASATCYWGFVRAEEFASRPDNTRRVIFDQRIQRGRILDRRGTVLAETRFDEDGLPERVYPVASAAPVTGYQTWRYGAGSGERATYGAGAAEAAYDAALRGDLGLSLRQLLAGRILHRPQRGHDVVLTLDAQLQQHSAELIGDREGAVVVVDVATGAVRALVSLPTFDPSILDAGGDGSGDPRHTLFNRATQGRYPPGSTWKAVTLAAALSEGLTRPDIEVDDGAAVEYFQGFAVGCNNNPEGVVRFDVAHAFGWSCNVTFARLGEELGEERFRKYSQAFGADAAPPFPLPVAESALSRDDEMPLPELVSAAFGQGEVLVTPLEMALVAAAVAGDGSLPVPHLLEDVPGVRYRAIADERGTWRRAISAVTARQMRHIMVISVRDGWAESATRGLTITAGGKTGTAQVAAGPPHSWFIGFAPAEEPHLAIAVLVVHGGQGGAVAAPIAGRVLQRGLMLEAEP